MSFVFNRKVISIFAFLFLIVVMQIADSKPKKSPSANNENPIVNFLKDNGIVIEKKVVAIRVTGNESTPEGPRAVMKVIAIKDEPNTKRKFASKEEERAVKMNAMFIKGANKLSADVIRTVIGSIVEGIEVKDGDTKKVADVEIYFDDGSLFNLVVGEDFSQIVCEKILWKPENPFSKEPVQKSINTLSFTSSNLLKSIEAILEPKGE